MVNAHTIDTDLVFYLGVCDDGFKLMQKNAKEMSDCDLYEKGFLECSLVKGQERCLCGIININITYFFLDDGYDYFSNVYYYKIYYEEVFL